MGWWEQDDDGHSFALGSGMYWGDGPADIMDDAIERIVDEFVGQGGRGPTVAEVKAGLLFSLSAYPDDEAVVAPERSRAEPDCEGGTCTHPHDADWQPGEEHGAEETP